MPDESIPPEVRSFIASYIDSLVQLEILLLLAKEPDREWTADRVAAELRISPSWAEQDLKLLCQRGVLTPCSQEPAHYRHGASSPQLDLALLALQKEYQARRVTIINLIFAKPIDKLKDFADAFRLRKEKYDE